MQGKSRLVATTFLTSVVSIAAFACSSPAPAPSSAESTGSALEACHDDHAGDHTCRSITVTASRSYGAHPASHDGSVSLTPPMRFDIPESIAVTGGGPGKGRATLTVREGWRDVHCSYRADKTHNRYKLDSCDGWGGDDAEASKVTLHVNDGDHAQTTVATISLVEEGHCRPPQPDAGADSGNDAGTPDTGAPDTGPACDPTQCDDGNPCTDDTCGATGCTHGPAADGTACNDSNACTQADICLGGTCTGVNPVTCSASDQCHVAGTCDPATGACSNPAAADGTACVSGNLCVLSSSESCTAGVCGGGFLDCGGAECASTSCDSATGQCRPAPAGTPCTGGSCDGDYGCVPYPPAKDVTYLAPLCPPNKGECTSHTGVFNAASFGCDYAPLPAGTACSTGICDGNNACVPAGSPPATTSTPVTMGATCPVNGECTQPGSIDFALGQCAYVDLASGTACSTGTCDGHGSCQ